jgi:hypothetical protein
MGGFKTSFLQSKRTLNMKKVTAFFIIPLLITGIVGLNSCKDRAAKKEMKVEEKETVDTLEKQIEEHVYPLPTSAEVIKMLTELEVGFNLGISNPVENTKKYFSSTKRAVNLGVYGADLSYATLYNMEQDVINNMDAIRSLSNELNMSKIYNEDLYGKIKQNYDNRDKLVELLTNAFEESYVFLSENGQQTLALLVVGGAWVEGMYLTTHVSEAAYNVAGISKVLLEQKASFDTFIEITKPYMNDPSIGDFVKQLDPIAKVYAGLSTSLTETNIKDITKAITGIREQIVQ